MATWSDMPDDILEHITSFLLFPDNYRFGAVCKNWRFVVKQKWYPPSPQLPWLVLDEETETRKRKFYSLSENKIYSIDIPELQGRYICGSSHGWLIAVDIEITGILINPFTREFYELPPFPPYCEKIDVTTLVVENYPSDIIGEPRKCTFAEMQISIVCKAILSHDPKEKSDFTAMILFGEMNSPAFWKPGDSSWTLIDYQKCRIEDVVYFKEKFYVISAMNKLYVVDFEPIPKLRVVVPEIEIMCFPRQSYLMDFKGNLLLVERFCERVDKEKVVTIGFNAMEPNLEENVLYFWYDFDEYAIFLSRNSSIFVSSNDVPQCKKGGIYFTHITESFSAKEFGCHDLGYYDMIEQKVSEFYPFVDILPLIGAPIWLTPNLR